MKIAANARIDFNTESGWYVLSFNLDHCECKRLVRNDSEKTRVEMEAIREHLYKSYTTYGITLHVACRILREQYGIIRTPQQVNNMLTSVAVTRGITMGSGDDLLQLVRYVDTLLPFIYTHTLFVMLRSVGRSVV